MSNRWARWVRHVVSWLAAWGLAVATAISAGAQTPVGAQFQINTYTTRDQEEPSVTIAANGAFVVVWQSQGSSGTDDDDSIQGQRYAAGGSPQGGEFQINTFTRSIQESPSVAMDADADFIVVWGTAESDEPALGYWSIQGQRYASNGSTQGAQFQVNTYPEWRQYSPSVAMAADGDFVVVWHSYGSSGTDTNGLSVQGQRYASNGSTQGGQFQVNTYTTSYQFRPSVAAAPDGDFVVVWLSGSSEPFASLQGQRYASNGSTLGGEFQVNTYTSNNLYFTSVGMAGNGDFVVAWMSDGSLGTDSSDWSIQARRFASDGTVLGSQFQVNTYTSGMQCEPSVAMASDGGFVVVWYGDTSATDPEHGAIQGQRYASDGSV